jgi:NAD+ synthase
MLLTCNYPCLIIYHEIIIANKKKLVKLFDIPIDIDYYVVRQIRLLTKKRNAMNNIKNKLLNELGVEQTEKFVPKTAIRNRITYLKNYLRSHNLKAIVLGISGGVDSSTAGKIAQMAITELRQEGYDAQFIAVRLPSHVQKDEDDAQEALRFINPDLIHTINIGTAVDVITTESLNSFEDKNKFTPAEIDFHKGNAKARMRMISQYHLAGLYGGVVLGTDHNSEATFGFYTKHGDGACDLIVLNGLNKRQVRLCAKELGAAKWLYEKEATADLEELNEQVSDEEALGVTYDQLDDFLEGKKIEPEAEAIIIQRFEATIHKREMPVSYS